MAMNLSWEIKPATKQSTRVSDNVQVLPGQTFKIETSPDGVEILNVTNTDSEPWSVNVNVKVTVDNA